MIRNDRYREILWNPNGLRDTDPLPEDVQQGLVNAHPILAHRVATNHHLTPGTFDHILATAEENIVLSAVTNPNLPGDLQLDILEEADTLRRTLTANANLHEGVQDRIWRDHPELRGDLAACVALKDEYQRALAAGDNNEAIWRLAQNPSLSHHVQMLIWTNPVAETNSRLRLLSYSESIPEVILDEALRSDGAYVKALAENRHLSSAAMEVLWQEHPEWRKVLTGHDVLPSNILTLALEAAEEYPLLLRNQKLSVEDTRRLVMLHGADRLYVCNTPHPELHEEIYHDPVLRGGLPWNRHVSSDILERVTTADWCTPAILAAALRHPNHRFTPNTPVPAARSAAPWLIDLVAEEAGADSEAALALADNWRGSLKELLEAARLTSR